MQLTFGGPHIGQLPATNKNWWEPAVNQSSNMLWSIVLSKMAHTQRMDEQDRLLEKEKIKLDAAKEEARLKAKSEGIQKGLKYGEPEGEYDPYLKTTVSPATLSAQPLMVDGKPIGYAVRQGADLKLMANPKGTTDKVPTSIQEYKFAKDDPKFAEFLKQKALMGKPGENSFNLSMDKEGNINVTQGPASQSAGIPLSTGSKTEVEKKIVDVDASLGRVKEVISLYKPEYQELGTKWNNIKNSLREKAGLPIPAEDKQALSDFSNYKKTTVATMNEEIKRLTGAQMSESEAKRLMGGMPNPGTGFFDGDSPTEFEGALKATYKNLSKTKARLMWYRAKGMGDEQIKGLVKSDKAVSLTEMDHVINNRAAQIEREIKLRQPDIPPPALDATVRQMLKSEFGID